MTDDLRPELSPSHTDSGDEVGGSITQIDDADSPALDNAGGADDHVMNPEAALDNGRPLSAKRAALIFGVVIVVALMSLVMWLGYRTHQAQNATQQRQELLSAGRQGALNLTTIDWQQADSDIERILNGASGTFYEDFSGRSGPFIELVKQAQSVSVGTITEAGLESETGSTAQVLVAVSVSTTLAGTPDPAPRAWRMRVDVEKVGEQAKVSNVEFVP